MLDLDLNLDLNIPNPEELLSTALQNNLDSAILEFDESHIPQAQNVAEWLLEPQFSGVSRPYPRQLQIAILFCEDACPDCSDWNWLQYDVPVDCALGEIRDRTTLLLNGVCPKCHKNKLDFYNEKKFHFYEELNGLAGQRGGKTALASFLWTYQTHRFLRLPNPARYFGLLQKAALQITFTAVTSTQADETIWQAYKDVFDPSPWFKNYNQFLKLQADKLGVPFIYSAGDTYRYYAHKNIFISYASPDKRTLRGRTRIGASIDEIGWFDSGDETKVRANSDETYEALVKSLQTIRSGAYNLRQRGFFNVPTAWMINISSPSHARDKIMRLIKESKTTRTHYAFHYATHEMNPTLTLESLGDKINSVKGKRDYLAIPPLAHGQFIEDRIAVERCIPVGEWEPLLKARRKSKMDSINNADTLIYAELAKCPHDKATPRILTVDAGEYYNAFSMAICRYDVLESKMIVEFAIEIKPLQRDEASMTAVHFPSVFEDFILPVSEALDLKYVVYDRWQSTDQVQRLRDRKVEAEQYTATWNDHLGFRSRLYGRQIVLPQPEIPLEKLNIEDVEILSQYPHAHLIIQCLTVREIGKKVVKPIGDDDDLYRCVLLADAYINYYRDKFITTKVGKRKGRKAAIAGGGRYRTAVNTGRSSAISSSRRR